MVSCCPLSRVVPLPNVEMTYKWVILTTYKSWDDPPSIYTCELYTILFGEGGEVPYRIHGTGIDLPTFG